MAGAVGQALAAVGRAAFAAAAPTATTHRCTMLQLIVRDRRVLIVGGARRDRTHWACNGSQPHAILVSLHTGCFYLQLLLYTLPPSSSSTNNPNMSHTLIHPHTEGNCKKNLLKCKFGISVFGRARSSETLMGRKWYKPHPSQCHHQDAEVSRCRNSLENSSTRHC